MARFYQRDGRTELAIDLDPCGSVFVVFRELSAGIDPVVEVKPENGRVVLDEKNRMRLLAGSAGTYTIKQRSGKMHTVQVDDLNAPLLVESAWTVQFDGPGLLGESTVDFPTLSDWKDHPRDDIKHFSGTATYRTTLELPANWKGSGKRIHLDLGRVEIAAEVILNGKTVDMLWKPPFVADVTDQVKEGVNQLEVRLTNLWANRLIGDEKLEDRSGYTRGNGEKMPEWYVNNEPLPKGPRSTFTTFNFYSKDRKLMPSGLLGPVRLVQQSVVPVDVR